MQDSPVTLKLVEQIRQRGARSADSRAQIYARVRHIFAQSLQDKAIEPTEVQRRRDLIEDAIDHAEAIFRAEEEASSQGQRFELDDPLPDFDIPIQSHRQDEVTMNNQSPDKPGGISPVILAVAAVAVLAGGIFAYKGGWFGGNEESMTAATELAATEESAPEEAAVDDKPVVTEPVATTEVATNEPTDEAETVAESTDANFDELTASLRALAGEYKDGQVPVDAESRVADAVQVAGPEATLKLFTSLIYRDFGPEAQAKIHFLAAKAASEAFVTSWADFTLATDYATGFGTDVDYSKAVPLLENLVTGDNRGAEYQLGRILADPSYSGHDLVRAKELLSSADAKGVTPAGDFLKTLSN
jgi:hypothetical protein